MSILIVNNCGVNSASKIAPNYDVCVIESLVNDYDGNDFVKKSFVVDVVGANPTWKRIRNDEDVSDFISDLYGRDEIENISVDEKTHDIIINLRELGHDSLVVAE